MFGLRRRAKVGAEDSLARPERVPLLDASPQMAPAYDTLVSNLHLLSSPRPLRSVLVTSTQPEEGKTTVAINLALTMACASRRVFLLDADLRRPRVHTHLQLDNTRGFADVLAGALGVPEVVQIVKVANDALNARHTLSVVTSGSPSPSAFDALRSPKLRETLESLTAAYDMVIVDSPPVLSVSDALIVTCAVDGTLLVVSTGVVTEKDAARAKERLEKAGGRLLGVVMNCFDEAVHGPALNPYHSYYEEPSAGHR